MPTYQYECDGCQHAFEILQSMLDAKLKKCPQCNQNELHRLIGAGSGIIFKGSGFYETDYKKKDRPQSEPKTSAKESKDKSADGNGKVQSECVSTGDVAQKSSNQPSKGSKEPK